MSDFDADTALVRSANDRFEGHIADAWRVGRGPNGGYVAALLLRAAQVRLDDPTRPPRSLTVHYLAPADVGPCRVETTLERNGRTIGSLSARLLQGNQTLALALIAFGATRPSIAFADASMPDVAPPDVLPPLPVGGPGRPGFAARYEYRWGIGDPPFSRSDSSRVGGWLRLAEPRVADALSVAAMLDAWLPCVFPRLEAPIAAPTVDLTIHFRTALPLPGARPDDYYLGVFSSRLAADGYFEEDGELWSRDGRLLAHSRQLAMLPTAR